MVDLEKVGLLRRDPSKPRAIEVLVDKAKQAIAPGGLPLVGQVAAGQPVLAEENIEDYLEVPEIAGGEAGEFILRVKGDSMKEAGILEGDHVIVRRQDTAGDGEIVVALVGEEATVKRFFRESDHVRLQPENPAMEPIRTRDVQVVGQVVGVCRRVA
jgi:repressor LexA